MGDPIRVVVADDHPAIRYCIQEYLRRAPDFQIVAEVERGAEIETAVRAHRPDLLILDLSMESGFRPDHAVRSLRKGHPLLRVFVLSGYAHPRWVKEMLAADVQAYALKSEPLHVLIEALRGVAHGGIWYSPRVLQQLTTEHLRGNGLTPRETSVLQGIADGQDLAGVAAALGVTERTVERYLHTAATKVGAQTRTEAVVLALRKGLIR